MPETCIDCTHLRVVLPCGWTCTATGHYCDEQIDGTPVPDGHCPRDAEEDEDRK